MKTLTLDQLAQSEFALNPNASLQVTGGAEIPIPRNVFRWGTEFIVGLIVEAAINNIGLMSSVDIFGDRPTDCEILTGYCSTY